VRPARSWLTRKRLAAAAGGLAALVGFLVGVTTLIQFVAGLDSDEPPPAAIDARVSAVDLTTRRVPYEDYLRSTNESPAGLSEAERKEKGLVFETRVRFIGGQGEPHTLRMSLFNFRTGRPVPHNTHRVAEFTPQAQSHGREWPAWLPYALHPGTFFARATLLDKEGKPVDQQDSEPFRVNRVPPLIDESG
jgi:hypothetical protein